MGAIKEVKLRPLTRADRKLLTAMVKRLAEKVGSKGILDVFNADVVEEAKESTQETGALNPALIGLGVKLLSSLIEHFEIEMDQWFASLLDCSIEELDTYQIGVDLEIINQLVESEEAEDFFSNALRLRNWTNELLKKFRPKKKD
jgi:hypothetical protein